MRANFFDKFIIVVVLLLIGFAVFLQISTIESTDKLKKEELKTSEQYARQIATLIEQKTDNNIEEALNRSPKLRVQLNETLQAFLTKQYQYIFVLKKDKKGKYRFLLDASKVDSEKYKALFFPKSKLFENVCKTGKMQIVEQHNGVEDVWLSLLYPIVKEGKTEALLVLDLSETYGEYLSNFHSTLMSIITTMQIFLGISFFSLIFFAYRYYKARRELRQDKLTSVYTKYYLKEFFNEHQVADYYVMLIEIDEFKEINKKLGNDFGDKAIKEFANVIVNTISPQSKVIRTGGTEFLVLALKDSRGVEKMANILFNRLKNTVYTIDNEVIRMYISMSAMNVTEESTSIERIQRLLDEKLLEVKSHGKNDLRILSEENLNNEQYSDIDYIKEALEEERLLCLYQPIYNTQTKKIVKYEALVRLIDKDNPEKLISPFYFMDVIKGTSQYIKMSKLVLNHVLMTLQRYPNLEVTVNVDLDDLDNEDMMKLITTNLTENKEIANRLTFEILEENEIKDYEKVQDIFKQLKAYGSKIALDDFGSGYASYSYLIRLDIDILKIDGSLIRELQTFPERAKAVLKSIQELADKFDYQLVAEFVSHEDIYDMVKELDIEYSQGYYLGEPKPIEAYLQ